MSKPDPQSINGILFKKNIRDRKFIFTSCHRIPERSIFYKGKPLICYRCGGINLGFMIAFLFQFISIIFSYPGIDYLFGLKHQQTGSTVIVRFGYAAILQLPFIIDGTIQALVDRYESKNLMRLFTGSIGGVGQFYFIYGLGRTFAWFFL